ncbi:MAG TPA: protein kinase [Haliangium sp.]|nr:protein kinase [Haliangium sp.]
MDTGAVIAERYRIERLAFEGGMGVVYLGRDLQDGGRVGIKLLRTADDPSSTARFWREAYALSSLRHPGIVRYLSHGLTQTGHPYLVMEWLDGEDLAARLRRGPLDVLETLRIGIRVCDAMGAAHRHGIIHRDIKPANLFLPGGRIDDVTVVDFGLARVGQTMRESTPVGELMGTPGFMAPEQVRSDPDLDHRADIYSIGASLYACLVQRPPFVGDHHMAILAKVLFEEPPRLSDLRPGVPERLDELIAQLVAKNPEARPADASVVASALIDILGHLGADLPVKQQVAPAITAGEQRFLTVLLVQGGAVSGRARRDALAHAADTYGAHLEDMADGTIAGIFAEHGRPVEMAERAARAALSMQTELGGGPVVLATGRGIVSDRLPVGQVIDRAVSMFLGDADTLPPGTKLEDNAPESGQIVVDDVTAGLLDSSFSVAPLGPRRYRLLGIDEDAEDTAPRLLGVPTPCVGRQRELATLEGLLDECIEEEHARAILLTGPSGAGKSRIRTELLQRLEGRYRDLACWLGRGDWLRSGASYGLLADVLRDAMDLTEGQPLEERRQRIVARVTEAVPAEEIDRVSVFLGEIVNVPFDEADRIQLAAARRDHKVMHDQMRRAFLDWLGAELERKPVLIVLDDLHWGDLPTIRFLDGALRNLRERPLMVLALAQPQVHKLFPDLFAARDLEEIRLRPLSQRACRTLVQYVLKVPEVVVEQIVDRCEGNAFFLEELIRSVAEGGDELPQTVLALAEARLSALPAPSRRLLRAASVFGRTFWRGGITALLGDAIAASEIDELLAALIEREFIAERATARFAGQREYRFASELTREVAYGTLTEQDRAHGHVRAGTWLEEMGEPDAVVLAEHYRRGGAITHAVDWYRRAAEAALEANDTRAVMDRVEQAVACGASGRALGWLRLLQAKVYNWQDEREAAYRCGSEAIQLLPRGQVTWAEAIEQASWAAAVMGRPDEVETLIELLMVYIGNAPSGGYLVSMAHIAVHLAVSGRYEQARTVASLIHQTRTDVEMELHVTAAVTHLQSILAYLDDQLDRACDLMLEAADLWQELGNQHNWLMDLGNAGSAQMELGEYEDAVETLEAVGALLERMGFDQLTGMNKANRALALAHCGRIDEAKRLCSETFATSGAPRHELVALIYLARILDLDADQTQALAHAKRALDLAQSFPVFRAQAHGIQARALLHLGLREEGLDASRQGMTILDELGGIESGEGILRLAHAEALHASGHHAEASAAIEEASARLLARAEKIADAAKRRSFLERVPEHARTLQLERQWLARTPSVGIAGEPDRGNIA